MIVNMNVNRKVLQSVYKAIQFYDGSITMTSIRVSGNTVTICDVILFFSMSTNKSHETLQRFSQGFIKNYLRQKSSIVIKSVDTVTHVYSILIPIETCIQLYVCMAVKFSIRLITLTVSHVSDSTNTSGDVISFYPMLIKRIPHKYREFLPIAF